MTTELALLYGLALPVAAFLIANAIEWVAARMEARPRNRPLVRSWMWQAYAAVVMGDFAWYEWHVNHLYRSGWLTALSVYYAATAADTILKRRRAAAAQPELLH